ncbi:MAG: eukaryotic-like serine/threonine-protein kinase, partial [Pseudonocardiales bacterium]|nr:eukaryotic-like serine/threonine-protein kinase [Pseudonocardiales bacterium]
MSSPLRVRGYTVERRLGSGATGDVWQARAIGSGALVALKQVPVADEDQRARARSEAALLAALDHPNLVRLHTLIEVEAAVVLVLDLADGGSLAELLAARGRLEPGEVITAIAPIAAALEHMHDAGVVHGDVSAANSLYTAGGAPLLADVGVARLTGDEDDAAATPAYIDPAVAAGYVPGAASDVFMLAGVALHALTGAPPWPDPDPVVALAHAEAGVLDDVPQRLAAAAVPPAMAAALSRALDVDPRRRGTAADLALDLAHSAPAVAVDLAAGSAPDATGSWSGPRHAVRLPTDPPPTRLVARPRPVIPRPPHGRRNRRGRIRRAPLVVALAVAGVVAAAGIVVVTNGGGVPRPRAVPASPVPASPLPASPLPMRGDGTGVAAGRAELDWVAELDRLDAVRARAFARRRPALLRNVYLSGALRVADAATLSRLVPAGCELRGARTSYSATR